MTASKKEKSQAPPAKRDAKAVKAQKPPRKNGAVKKKPAKDIAGFPIVGIGASAGGLAAFEAFFSGMPAASDPGMAFVLVQHLAPDHKSILCDLIRRYTRMQVFEVEDGMTVRPNCAYIIPPNRDMAFLNGSLQLLEPEAPHGQRLPIDFFFRSLAQDQHDRAIGIILSGTGCDGTQGVRAIKAEGGMVMAQTPLSADYGGMPQSAIATGLVDYELPAVEMPAQLMAYASHSHTKPSLLPAVQEPRSDNALKKIFILLRAQAGHDFSHYKPNTINRRIERRMAVHQIKSADAYVKYLQQTPGEVEALFRDLLIGVTNFFRDPEAFKALETQVIPKLFEGRTPGSLIRVWTPGCATSEEAYSIAILLQERMEALKQHFKVQIFATDIDRQAIVTARAGLYPAGIASDISPERLSRFFEAESDGSAYRIHKSVRDMLVFSEQNVIKDPPFSKLDLISCRNLMIYMDKELQRKLIPLFHYALNPGGFLFLGTSETVGEFSDLFAPLDRKLKLYKRKDSLHGMAQSSLCRFLPQLAVSDTAFSRLIPKVLDAGRLPLRALTERALLQEAAPSAALVNSHGDILYLHGQAGMYLEVQPGESGVNNILKMAREGLRLALSTALRKAGLEKGIVRQDGLRVKMNGGLSTVNLSVLPLKADIAAAAGQPMFLIIFEEAASVDPGQAQKASALNYLEGTGRLDVVAPEAGISAFKQELRAMDEYINTTLNELETSNEELKSTNEEMQSVNEELQSTNEEMETAKEELQSVNEELATVNAELQTKVADLSRANNDMNNLLAGTGIATLFVDHHLRIMRFTPASTQIINLILSDVGRPVGHIVSNLRGYDSIAADTQAVLDTLLPKELEVQTTAGSWFTMRIQPYRTIDNVIEGAVITFTDITECKKANDALRKAIDLNRLALVAHDNRDAMVVQDMEGRILAWNPSAERVFGWSETEALKMNIRDLIPAELRQEELVKVQQLSRSETLESYRMRRVAKGGAVVEVWLTSTALINEAGQVYAVATTERAGGIDN